MKAFRRGELSDASAIAITSSRIDKTGDDCVSSDSLLITRLQTELFQETDAEEPRGHPVSPDIGPGQSSAYALFYSDKPSVTVKAVFRLLKDRLVKLFEGGAAKRE
jgi:hypothetical protein